MMTERPEALDEHDLDTIAAAGPFIVTRTSKVDAETVVQQVGALMRRGYSADEASKEVESWYMP